ncbi:hypothetical protein HZC31_05640 [Candidatus Woesearchaeota archaeon]|nr:hypothetical protein [Candidatus Woesearchaeota archaeon]
MITVNYEGLDFNRTVRAVQLCNSRTNVKGLDALVLDTSVLLREELAPALELFEQSGIPLFTIQGVVEEVEHTLAYTVLSKGPSRFISSVYVSLQEHGHVLDVKTTGTPLSSESALLRELSKGIGKGVVETLVDHHFDILFAGLHAALKLPNVKNRPGTSQIITQHIIDGRPQSEYSSPAFIAAQQCVKDLKLEFMSSYDTAVLNLRYVGSLDMPRFRTTLRGRVLSEKGRIVDSYLRSICPWFLGKVREGYTKEQIKQKFHKEYKGHNATDRKLVLASYGLLPAMGYAPSRVGIFSVDRDIADLIYLRQSITLNTASSRG